MLILCDLGSNSIAFFNHDNDAKARIFITIAKKYRYRAEQHLYRPLYRYTPPQLHRGWLDLGTEMGGETRPKKRIKIKIKIKKRPAAGRDES